MKASTRRLSRRKFLQVSAATVVAGAAYAAVPQGFVGSQSNTPAARRVLTNELRLGPGELGQGTLAGLSALSGGLTLHHEGAAGQYLSSALESWLPFHYAGIYWAGSWPEGAEPSFWLRTSADGSIWSDWQPVQVDLPPGPIAEYDSYGSLVGANGHRFVQFMTELRGAPGATTLDRVGLTLLNPFDGPVLEAPPAAEGRPALDPAASPGDVALALPRPLSFSREDWGCDESIRFAGGQEIWPRDYISAKTLVVHHTVTPNGYASIEEAKAQVRSIYAYHTITQGWGDIGYNWLIDKFGNAYEGRRGRDGPGYDGPGGRELVSQNLVAGHALIYNHGSSGVALLGTFCTPNECAGQAPSGVQLARLEDVLAFECARHGLHPEGVADFPLRNGGWHGGLPYIVGHRDVGETSCPGGHVYSRLPEIRSHLAARLSDPAAPAVGITSSPPATTVHENRVQFSWAGSGAGPLQYSYYLEGWRYEGDGSVTYLHGFNANRGPAWSPWSPATTAEFAIVGHGVYTMHVMVRDASGRTGVYNDRRSFFGQPASLPEGALLQGSGPAIFVVQSGIRRQIPDPATFEARGFRWGSINRVPDGVLHSLPAGRAILSVMADGNLLKGSGPAVYVMHGGGIRHVAGPSVMDSCGYGWDAIYNLPDWVFVGMPIGPVLFGPPGPRFSPPEGALIKGSRPHIYVMQAGIKRHVPNPVTLEASGLQWGNVDVVPDSSLAGIPIGDRLLDGQANGNLLQGSGPAIYVMENGRKRHVLGPSVMDHCGYGWDAVRRVTDGLLAAIPTGAGLSGPPCPALVPPDGALVQGSGAAIYVMENGQKRHILGPSVIGACDYRWGNVNTIPNGHLNRIPSGGAVNGSSCPLPFLPDGTMVKGSGPAIYVMQQGRKRHILGPSVLDGCHYDWRDVRIISDSLLSRIPLGPTLTGPPCP